MLKFDINKPRQLPSTGATIKASMRNCPCLGLSRPWHALERPVNRRVGAFQVESKTKSLWNITEIVEIEIGFQNFLDMSWVSLHVLYDTIDKWMHEHFKLFMKTFTFIFKSNIIKQKRLPSTGTTRKAFARNCPCMGISRKEYSTCQARVARWLQGQARAKSGWGFLRVLASPPASLRLPTATLLPWADIFQKRIILITNGL